MGSRIPIKQAKAIGRIHCAAAAKIGDALRDNVAPTLERQVAEIEDLKLQLAKATGK